MSQLKPAVKMVMKNVKAFHDQIDKEDRERIKAANTAVKVEGYRLRSQLQKEIRSGSPGGSQFAPLREVSKRLGKGAVGRSPLNRLAVIVQAYFTFQPTPSGQQYINKFQVGFVDTARFPLSRSWQRIVKLQQEGGKVLPTQETRSIFAAYGSGIKSASIKKYFYLRSTTTQLNVPSRPIIDPFWKSEQMTAQRNIVRNFELKMAGHRI